ncbi:MAG: type II and III secretion system protein family protein [Candidatus Jettenia sp. CY-1]|nr:MAG: type II and III secretion system protein family protein [Candidatus Jettenia sp. CY-1]
MADRVTTHWYNRVSFPVTITLVLIFSFQGWADNPARVRIDTTQPRKLILTVRKSTIVRSQRPVKRISLAAPEIADVTVLTPKEIYITGKTPGLTNLTLWDENDRPSTIFDLEVLPDIDRLKERLYEMFPREENIRVTATNEGITLSGTVSSTTNISQVIEIAQSYAPVNREGKYLINNFLEVGGVHQVMLEVRVSEMSRTLIKRLGVNFNFLSNSGRQFGISILDNLARIPPGTPPAATLNTSDSINLIFRFLSGGATWTMFIDALKENGLLKILAEPTLITLSGKTAYFLAGGEFPVPVPQSGAGGGIPTITIYYKPFGVGLNFTPTVLSNNKINMQVAPEVSELDFTNAISLQGFTIPALTTRRVSTEIELAEGQSFAIAGLLNEEVRQTVTKFPLFGDIPVLGALFRSNEFRKNETELVIVVTPHLVKPIDLAKQTLPTDAYREPNDYEFYLLGRMEGKGKESFPGATTSSSISSKHGGLEGDFGHIKP